MQPKQDFILCYVTDRRAFDKASVPHIAAPIPPDVRKFPEESLLEPIRKAAGAGVDWIQIREKDLDARALTDLVRRAVTGTRQTGTQILVNDRLDVALAAGAAGVHLAESSVQAGAVAKWRRSAVRMEFQIGVSCHSMEAARAAEDSGADYIFFGPVFATPSKALFGAPQGIDRLHEVCRAVRIPVLAIGGVTIENVALCHAAGVRGVAAIRLFQESEDISAVAKLLRK